MEPNFIRQQMHAKLKEYLLHLGIMFQCYHKSGKNATTFSTNDNYHVSLIRKRTSKYLDLLVRINHT